jgi:hypothetical protein
MKSIPFFQRSFLKSQKVTRRLNSFIYLEDIHKNMSHPKKLKLSILSEHKKYSEWVEKGSLDSNESWLKKELLKGNEGKKEEQVRRSFLHLESIRFRMALGIHYFLLFIVNFFVINSTYLQYFQQDFFSQSAEIRVGGIQ